MNHIIYSVLHITFIFLGAWTITVYILYRKSHKKVLGIESGVGLSTMAITGGLQLYYYGYNCGIATGFMPAAISFAGTLSILIFLPIFTHTLLCIPVTRPIKVFFRVLAIYYASALIFIPKTTQYELVGPFAGKFPGSLATGMAIITYGIIFYGTVGYCFVLGILYGKNIGDKSLRRIRAGTFAISLIFLPALVIFTISGKQTAAVLCLSMMFLSLSVVNLYFSIFFSNQPAFFHDNSLSDYFARLFHISEREKEVVTLLLDGMANKEIADKLRISVRTVENHLSSIYQKTETSGRVQLINLIRVNSF